MLAACAHLALGRMAGTAGGNLAAAEHLDQTIALLEHWPGGRRDYAQHLRDAAATT
jgi:hypothetical protein